MTLTTATRRFLRHLEPKRIFIYFPRGIDRLLVHFRRTEPRSALFGFALTAGLHERVDDMRPDESACTG